MKAYNLYYKNECINNKPLSLEELDELFKVNNPQYIYKKHLVLDDLKSIDRKKIKIVVCTIV